jgi:hypothetical protein
MTLDRALQELYARLRTLDEHFANLHTTVVEDRPQEDDVVLVDMFADTADELRGWLAEALDAAIEAEQATRSALDVDAVRRALATCQTNVDRLAERFAADLVAYERIAALVRVGRDRGGEWRAWANSTRQAIEECQKPLSSVQSATSQSWQELVERACASPRYGVWPGSAMSAQAKEG